MTVAIRNDVEFLFIPSWGIIKGEVAMQISLRPAETSDHPFLFDLYASTRAEEVSALGWDLLQQQAFIRLQYRAQQWQYQGQLTQMEDFLVLEGEEPVGRMLISHEPGYIHLADLALLSKHQGKGIGTELIKSLQAKASRSGKAIRLNAPGSNRAVGLFKRLGFKVIQEQGNTLEMEWRVSPGAQRLAKRGKMSRKPQDQRMERG